MNSIINPIPYKEIKENVREISKDLKIAAKWLDKTSNKLKKFNERDIFEEHDRVEEQLKALSGSFKKIVILLADTMERTSESIKDIVDLYKYTNLLAKRVIYLEKNKADRVNALEQAFQNALLGQL